MKHTITIVLCFFSVISVSCSKFHFGSSQALVGNGQIISENRGLNPFTAIHANGVFSIVLSQSNNASLRIETDSNLLPYVLTKVTGNTLTLDTKDNINPTKGITVTISGPQFTELQSDGVCSYRSDGKIKVDELKLAIDGTGTITLDVQGNSIVSAINGAGTIELSGNSSQHAIEINGSGDIKAHNLQTVSTKVDISGAGDADVYVQKELDATISGSGNVTYAGDATSVKMQTSGSGRVKKI